MNDGENLLDDVMQEMQSKEAAAVDQQQDIQYQDPNASGQYPPNMAEMQMDQDQQMSQEEYDRMMYQQMQQEQAMQQQMGPSSGLVPYINCSYDVVKRGAVLSVLAFMFTSPQFLSVLAKVPFLASGSWLMRSGAIAVLLFITHMALQKLL